MVLRFLRHAESIGNATNDYSTDIHDRLSKRGHAQAEALIGRLEELPLEFIYCSPLERAVETIRPYIKATGKHMELWPDLAEVNGDEALPEDAWAQLNRAVHRLRERHHGRPDPVLVVSHGHTLSRMLELFLEIPPTGRFGYANTGISRIEEIGDRIIVRYLNRVASANL